ncbi:hypothetical protein ACO0QE_003883 [Hanseniaspora vineae]
MNSQKECTALTGKDIIYGYIELITKSTKTIEKIPIHKAKILKFGRNSELCKLHIDNRVISGTHCKFWGIQFDENTLPVCYVQDVSLNGSFVVSKATKNNLNLYTHHKLVKYECHPLQNGNYVKFPTIEDFYLRFTSHSQYANGDCNDEHVFKDLKINKYVHDEWVIQPIFVGAGTYGHVMITKAKNSGKVGAVKIIKNMSAKDRSLTQDQRNNHTMRETKLLLELDHPNIIKMYSTVISNGISPNYKDYYIFQQLVFGGDLFSYLAKSDSLMPVEEEECLLIVYQILLALKYLHARNIVHRDLKLDNILLRTPEPCTKIILADFGIAKRLTFADRLHTVIGTPEYCAPEVGFQNKQVFCKSLTKTVAKQHEKEGYDFKCDMWSLGVIAYIALTGVSPFFQGAESTTENIFDKMLSGNLNFGAIQWANITSEAKHFVQSLLTVDTKKRLGAEQALQHKWISQQSVILQKIYKKKILNEEPCFEIQTAVKYPEPPRKKTKIQPSVVKSYSCSL